MIKKISWWGWVLIVVAILFLWQGLSGWAQSRRYYNLFLNQIKKDQSQIIKDREEWIKSCEAEIVRLQSEKEQIQREKFYHQKQATESAAEVIRLKGTINALQTQLQNIVVSDDPDRIISDLQRLRIRSIRRRNLR